MKKLIGALAFTMVTICCFAAESNKIQGNIVQDTTKMGAKQKIKKDCLMMKHGQMMIRKDGQKTKMTKTMTLSNGTRVGTDGTVTMTNGTTTKLKDGDKIFMDGKMGKPKTKKDKA